MIKQYFDSVDLPRCVGADNNIGLENFWSVGADIMINQYFESEPFSPWVIKYLSLVA